MFCEKAGIGLSRNFKVAYVRSRKIFVDTLFSLAKNTSTDHILACAALELLQHLFKLASPVKFLNMIFFGLECLSFIHLYQDEIGNFHNFVSIFNDSPPQESFCPNTLYSVLERSSQSSFLGFKM